MKQACPKGGENLDVFVKPMSSYQEEGYNLIFEQLKRSENGKYLENDKVSYNVIQTDRSGEYRVSA